MSEASFASLGPTLLARKGGAKPAMRPQLAPLPEVVAAEQLEDLGWNDMGNDAGNDAGNDKGDIEQDNGAATPFRASVVPINPGADSPVARKAIAQVQAGTPAKHKRVGISRRAAFTLRLDAERHLKLRLAATMQGVSAQALVTDALDALLAGVADLDTLAETFIKAKHPNLSARRTTHSSKSAFHRG